MREVLVMRMVGRTRFHMGVATVALLALAACATPQAAATPTPQPPTASATVQSRTPTAAPSAVAVATPTSTPVPTAVKRGGKVIVAIQTEPTHLSVAQQFGEGPTGIDADRLIGRRPDTELYPQLAEKWEQIDSKTWRFVFRKGVKFWNGEDFTAEGIIADAVWQSTPANASRLARYQQGLTGKVIDANTVDIVCPAACPILPSAMTYLNFQAPKWAKDNPEQYKLTTMGLGPYQLVEWKKGEFYKMTRFEGYWGPRGLIDEGMIIFRPEAKVRAAMVGVGEAHLGLSIGVANRSLAPNIVIARPGVENSHIRTNSRADPMLKDKRVRQALAYAIDRDTIAKVLLAGMTKPKDNLFGNPRSVGWTEDPRTKYPYNPARAKQLIKEAGFEGSQTPLVIPSTSTDQLYNEILLSFASYWQAVGLQTKVVPIDSAASSAVGTPGVGKTSPYSVFFFDGHTNDRFDASGTLFYVDCRAPQSWNNCDEQPWFESHYTAADAASGTERQKGMEELSIWAMSEALLIPLWDRPVIHSMSNDIVWTPSTAIQTGHRWSDIHFK